MEAAKPNANRIPILLFIYSILALLIDLETAAPERGWRLSAHSACVLARPDRRIAWKPPPLAARAVSSAWWASSSPPRQPQPVPLLLSLVAKHILCNLWLEGDVKYCFVHFGELRWDLVSQEVIAKQEASRPQH